MKHTRLGSMYYLMLGLVFSPVGTLLLLRQPTLIGLISNLMSGIETIEIFALILQLLGEGLICFGLINTISGRVAAEAEHNSQTLSADIVKNLRQQIATLRLDLQQLQTQKAYSTLEDKVSLTCRFCGAPMMQNHFCPHCGKAN